MTDTQELWEDRFEIYCEQNRIDQDATPAKWYVAREAFKDGYEWGIADEIVTPVGVEKNE